MILLFVVLVITTLLFGITLVVAHDHIVTGDAPQIALEPEVIHEVLRRLHIGTNTTFYDFGCGDGRVLVQACQVQPSGKYIGIEKAFLPYLLAKYKTRSHRDITIVRKDVKKYHMDDTSDTVVFMYLLPKAVDIVSLRLKQQLTGRIQIVSIGWPMPSIPSSKRIRLKSSSTFAKYWYIYTN